MLLFYGTTHVGNLLNSNPYFKVHCYHWPLQCLSHLIAYLLFSPIQEQPLQLGLVDIFEFLSV